VPRWPCLTVAFGTSTDCPTSISWTCIQFRFTSSPVPAGHCQPFYRPRPD
jgi:hypothetical protein